MAYDQGAFNSPTGFGGSWLDTIQGFGSPMAQPLNVPVTMGAPVSVTPPMVGVDPMAGALDRYSQSLGRMQTKDWMGAGLGAVQTIGGLVGAFGSLGLANKQYKLQKRMAETNLTNSVQAYNTALDDKARSRATMEGQSDAERDAYIRANSATTGR